MEILLGIGKGSQERKDWDFSKDCKILVKFSIFNIEIPQN